VQLAHVATVCHVNFLVFALLATDRAPQRVTSLQEGLQPLRKDEEERLRRVFDRIDKNADGYMGGEYGGCVEQARPC